VKRLGVAIADSEASSPQQRLSIGALVINDELSTGTANDPTMSLIECLAYLDDMLSFYQDQVADESYLDVERERGSVLTIRLGAGLRPAFCLIAGDHRAFFVAVGADTEDSRVRFGDGFHGRRPPRGVENVVATYRRGSGDTGNIELRGLDLDGPLAILVVGDPRASRPCFHSWRSRMDEGS